MSSQQKIDASRANARKSTGPKTTAGKAVCRTNAYRHGMRTRAVLMPGEDSRQYTQLFNSMCQEYESPTRQDLFQIKQMATARWRLERLKGIETALLDQPTIDSAALVRISHWQVRAENSYYKALKQLNARERATG